MATDFPKKGDDKKISLRNSNYPVFDKRFAAGLKENNPEMVDNINKLKNQILYNNKANEI